MTSISENFFIILPALLLGILLIVSHIPLGQEVIRRGIIFMDIAISQIAVFGLLLGQWLTHFLPHWHGHDLHNFLIQFCAYCAAVAGSLFILSMHKRQVKTQEAIIGICFILASTGAIIFTAAHPHGAEQLKHAMVGQILWVQPNDIVNCALFTLAFAGVWLWVVKQQKMQFFYPIFAIMITYSTQLIGVYLVFATLIVPTLVSRNCTHPIYFAYSISIVSYCIGLLVAALFDLPAGAVIAWTLVLVAFVSWLLQKLTLHRRREYRGVL